MVLILIKVCNSDRLQFLSIVSGIKTLTIWYKLHSASVIEDSYPNYLFDTRTGNPENRLNLTITCSLALTYYSDSAYSGTATVKNSKLYINNEIFINKNGGDLIIDRNETDVVSIRDKLYSTRVNVWTLCYIC